jgi:DNA-binding IclR family transcriptional regulator
MKAQRGIQSVEVGGRLLLALAHEGRSMALKDLAQAAGMAPPKAHPYLVSFGKLGLIAQDEASGHYGLGPLAMQLGLISLQQSDPVRLASAQLPGLAVVLGQTVGIAVWGLARRNHRAHRAGSAAGACGDAPRHRDEPARHRLGQALRRLAVACRDPRR